jgi:hypothetical protein
VSTELEWSSMLPGDMHALDEDAADRVPTATHSSPISTVRTPPDFSNAAVHQHQFAKQLDSGGVSFDFDSASVAGELGAYHPAAAGYEMMCDPFGLDASLFSI